MVPAPCEPRLQTFAQTLPEYPGIVKQRVALAPRLSPSARARLGATPALRLPSKICNRLQQLRRAVTAMGIHTYGTMAVDWEERVRFDRLREERLARISSLLAESELGALLCFDMTNIRYITATHIGTWAQDKLNRYCLLPRDDLPIMWDFGSAARHHQLYNPWLGDGRSRAGISTLRGAMAPESGRAEDVARKIRVELEERGLLAEPVGVDALEPAVLFALQAEGVNVVDGQQLMQAARVVKTQDEITLLATACMMVDAAYEELYRAMRPGMRENECVALVNKVLYDMGSEHVEGVNAISGERCNPHPHVYTDRSLRPGDPAYFDILHSFMGYRTCYYRTFAVGGASRALVDAYKRCRYYLDAAIALIRPGATTAEVAQVWPRAEEFGFADEEAAFALQFGHGVGLSIWEKPIFSRLVSLDHPEEIREGMVFALETFWPASDGWSAARIEEQLVVTADGCEVITRFPAEDLVVAGKPYYTVGGALPLERETQSNLNTRLDPDRQEAVPGNGRMPAGDPVRL
jgi:Xaa-Pro aminopeptidase